MRVLIIEDETPAAEKLARYLKKYDANINVVGQLQSIAESVSWLQANQEPLNLILSDIQLTDGLSFEIFQQVSVNTPVIFTTAYDEYAVDAFRVNSVGYLLKPVTFLDLSTALKKIDKLRTVLNTQEIAPKIAKDLSEKKYKNRFLVKVGEHIQSIKTEDSLLFYAEGRTAYLVTAENKKFIVDFKLEELESLLNPKEFFRVNRTFIININTINEVLVYSNSRLKVNLKITFDKEIVVSREKVTPFKEWFDGQS